MEIFADYYGRVEIAEEMGLAVEKVRDLEVERLAPLKSGEGVMVVRL